MRNRWRSARLLTKYLVVGVLNTGVALGTIFLASKFWGCSYKGGRPSCWSA